MTRTTRLTTSMRPLAVLLLAGAAAICCHAQANVQGQWTAVQTWPNRAVHATLLPDGRVFFVSYYTESLHPHIWSPVSNTFTATTMPAYELFCAGHTTLSNGKIFVAGGHIADFVGQPHVSIYTAGTNSFSRTPDMNKGRWYPTTTVLASGEVLVVSGDVNGSSNTNPMPQIYNPGTNSWRSLTTAQLVLPLYPLMFVAPNGKVFQAGPNRQTRYLSISGTGAWTNVALKNFTSTRTYGPGVMYETGKILVVGGGDPPTATAETIDLTSATPVWRKTGSMHFARRQHNAVVLPDGKVLIVGGSSGSGFDNSAAKVAASEMWDPATGQFAIMASIAKYRGYHSTALLLPDGRVLSAGGNGGGPNAQIYSPPYLFMGARPTISSAPVGAAYGQTVFIGTPNATSIAKVSLIRLGSTTHTFDQSARYMHLNFTQAAGGLNVTMPGNGNLAPPGYYMLFILNGSGVPSVARIMHVGGTAIAGLNDEQSDSSSQQLASSGGDEGHVGSSSRSAGRIKEAPLAAERINTSSTKLAGTELSLMDLNAVTGQVADCDGAKRPSQSPSPVFSGGTKVCAVQSPN